MPRDGKPGVARLTDVPERTGGNGEAVFRPGEAHSRAAARAESALLCEQELLNAVRFFESRGRGRGVECFACVLSVVQDRYVRRVHGAVAHGSQLRTVPR